MLWTFNNFLLIWVFLLCGFNLHQSKKGEVKYKVIDKLVISPFNIRTLKTKVCVFSLFKSTCSLCCLCV